MSKNGTIIDCYLGRILFACAGSSDPGDFMSHVGSLWVSLGTGQTKNANRRKKFLTTRIYLQFPNGKDTLLYLKKALKCAPNQPDSSHSIHFDVFLGASCSYFPTKRLLKTKILHEK